MTSGTWLVGLYNHIECGSWIYLQSIWFIFAAFIDHLSLRRIQHTDKLNWLMYFGLNSKIYVASISRSTFKKQCQTMWFIHETLNVWNVSAAIYCKQKQAPLFPQYYLRFRDLLKLIKMYWKSIVNIWHTVKLEETEVKFIIHWKT